MAITSVARPPTLSWTNFVSVANLVDPTDGTPQDSVTKFRFDIPDRRPRQIGNEFAMAETFEIGVTPDAKIRTGAGQTDALLAHEQLHYDVGICIMRRVAHELTRLRANSLAELRTAFLGVVHLHVERRAALIQRRYDIDSNHSLNHHYQHVWSRMIKHALNHPPATHIGGFWL